jgi:hypothetical protein
MIDERLAMPLVDLNPARSVVGPTFRRIHRGFGATLESELVE